MMMNFDELDEFSKEFKRLAKKYLSLPDDLEDFKKVVTVAPIGSGKHFNAITRNERLCIIKARFFCRYLRGASLRIIYAYHVHESKVVFLEIYFKGNKPNEDRERIKQYVSQTTTT